MEDENRHVGFLDFIKNYWYIVIPVLTLALIAVVGGIWWLVSGTRSSSLCNGGVTQMTFPQTRLFNTGYSEIGQGQPFSAQVQPSIISQRQPFSPQGQLPISHSQSFSQGQPPISQGQSFSLQGQQPISPSYSLQGQQPISQGQSYSQGQQPISTSQLFSTQGQPQNLPRLTFVNTLPVQPPQY